MRASRGMRASLIVTGVLIAVIVAALSVLTVRSGVFGDLRARAGVPATEDRNTVTVLGEGRAHATPDAVVVNLGVAARRGTVRAALEAANSEMAKVIEAVKAKGVDAGAIQTAFLSVGPNFEFGRVVGYVASNQVRVTISDLSMTSSIIATAAETAGDDAQFGGISFQRQDTTSLLKAAREVAMTSASAKAQDWARLAGRKLGKVMAVSEVVSSLPPGSRSFGGAGFGTGGGGVPIEPGQGDVTLVVTVVFALED